MEHTHAFWMKHALHEAFVAFSKDEVPVGAVLVKDNKLMIREHNNTNMRNNPLAHAEMLILNEIQSQEKYLSDYTLYITLEPCLMCGGAIILSRVGEVVYGCHDPKTGVINSIYQVMTDSHFNHHPNVIFGIMEKECSDILKKFFKGKR
jgi:tRNA(adenine34) deaminase